MRKAKRPIENFPGATSWEQEALQARPRLVSIAKRVVRRTSSAEDAADEAIARLTREVETNRRPDHAEAWLCRAVLRIAIDETRRLERQGRHLESYSAMVPPSRDGPQESLQRVEMREQVWRALLDLPEKQHQVMVLRQMEALTYAEIARLLEITESTARAHVSAGRETLRKKLSAYKSEIAGRTEQTGRDLK